ncbi:uncharacterized protein [Typha latifolia]|uniref:uncharacterized protein n=1 Tax=Typha latifolia TaxID=4733 RepID=UPI003C2AB31D
MSLYLNSKSKARAWSGPSSHTHYLKWEMRFFWTQSEIGIVAVRRVFSTRLLMDHVEGRDGPNLTQDEITSKCIQMQQDDKKAAVHAEIARVNQLPSNSSYAVHRMRMSASQEEELELLFASLSL